MDPPHNCSIIVSCHFGFCCLHQIFSCLQLATAREGIHGSLIQAAMNRNRRRKIYYNLTQHSQFFVNQLTGDWLKMQLHSCRCDDIEEDWWSLVLVNCWFLLCTTVKLFILLLHLFLIFDKIGNMGNWHDNTFLTHGVEQGLKWFVISNFQR